MDILLTLLAQAPYVGLFVMLLLGGVGIPIPEDITLILCGFLAAQEVVKPLPLLATIYPGLLIADSVLYSFGRRFGRAIIEQRRFRRLLPPKRLAELETKFQSRGSFLILFGRHIAGLRVQLFLAAGILRMPYGRFLLADALSALFTITVMAGIGYVGGNSLEVFLRDLKRIEHAALFAVITGITVFLLIRFFREGRRRNGENGNGKGGRKGAGTTSAH